MCFLLCDISVNGGHSTAICHLKYQISANEHEAETSAIVNKH